MQRSSWQNSNNTSWGGNSGDKWGGNSGTTWGWSNNGNKSPRNSGWSNNKSPRNSGGNSPKSPRNSGWDNKNNWTGESWDKLKPLKSAQWGSWSNNNWNNNSWGGGSNSTVVKSWKDNWTATNWGSGANSTNFGLNWNNNNNNWNNKDWHSNKNSAAAGVSSKGLKFSPRGVASYPGGSVGYGNKLLTAASFGKVNAPPTPSTMAPDSPSGKSNATLTAKNMFTHSASYDSDITLPQTPPQLDLAVGKGDSFWSKQLDWSSEGIPVPYQYPARYWEMPVLDWSPRYPPRAFYDAIKPDPIGPVDWSSGGVPFETDAFWDSVVLDWSGKGKNSIPKVFKKARWASEKNEKLQNYALDWTVRGLPEIFQVGSKRNVSSSEISECDLYCIDWSKNGLGCNKWKFWDYSLSLDWSSTGNPPLPAYINRKTDKYDPLCLDWSVKGAPRQFTDAPWCMLFNRDELVIDWSGRGMPKLFKKASQSKSRSVDKKLIEQIEHIDWSVDRIPFQFEFGKREKKGIEDCIESVDWSVKGLPKNYLKNGLSPTNYFVNNFDGAFFDWSAKGLPSLFAGITKGQEHTEKVKAIDWSSKGQPWQFTQMEKQEEDASVDWSRYGVPYKWNMWDNPGIVDWSTAGIPKLIKNSNYAPRYGEYFMPTPTGSNANITLFANGVPNLFAGPEKINANKKDRLEMESEWVKLGEVVFEKKLSKGGDRLRLTNAERSMLTYIEQWDYSRILFWEEQALDFSGPGLPDMFSLTAKREAKTQYQERHQDSLIVDWSYNNHKKKRLPHILREHKFWDHLSIDWSTDRLPRILYENAPGNNCYQFDPMILDWSITGIPMEIRNVWGGRRAAIETPLLDWSAPGIPKMLAMVARETGRRNTNPFDGEHLFAVDWSVERLPKMAWKAEAYEEPCQLDFSGPGLPKEFRVGDGFWDELCVDWNCYELPFYQDYADNISIKQYGLRKKMLKEEVAWVDWSKNGRPHYMKLGIGKPLCIDWSAAGIPREIDGAQFMVKGSNMPTVQLDWSQDGLAKELTMKRPIKRNYISFDWSSPGLPFASYSEIPFYMQTLDWSVSGIPHQILQGKSEDVLVVDWNLDNNLPVEVRSLFDIEFQLDWSVSGIPTEINICKRDTFLESSGIDWSVKGLPYCFRKINFDRDAKWDVHSIDWSKKGMPFEFDSFLKWESKFASIDWSCRGLPIVVHEAYDKWSIGVDWTDYGVAFVNSSFLEVENENRDFVQRPMKDLKRPIKLNKFQMYHVDSLGMDEHLISIKNHLKQKCADSPWNRCKDERREARFLHRVNHTKKTKKHLKLLLNLDTNQSYKMLINWQKRKRTLDKNQQRKEKDEYLGVLYERFEVER